MKLTIKNLLNGEAKAAKPLFARELELLAYCYSYQRGAREPGRRQQRRGVRVLKRKGSGDVESEALDDHG